MKVRDQALSPKEYKGRPTEALDSLCPCRPCWNAHDCGHINSQGKWVILMHCATNWNSGCPSEENRKPTHEFPAGKRRCIHCGAAKPKKQEG